MPIRFYVCSAFTHRMATQHQSGEGVVYFWGTSMQWRLAINQVGPFFDDDENNDWDATAIFVPSGSQAPPTDGNWRPTSMSDGPCICEDEPPTISMCTNSSCDSELHVTGMIGSQATGNGKYVHAKQHEGKPLYEQIGGDSIIFWDDFWMMNTTGKRTFLSPTTALPPLGQWTTRGQRSRKRMG